MLRTKNKVLIVFLSLAIFAAGSLHAQLRISSPYSRYGLGEVQNGYFAHSMAMGGLSFGVRDSLSLNIQNPASYTAFDSMSFLCNIGLNSDFTQLRTENITQDYTNHTSFDYLAFGFPVTRWWGASIGLVPYSRTGYKLLISDTVTGVGKVTGDYQGFGGLNRFYFGNGFKLYKDLSFGFNISFLFGTITNKSAVYFNDLSYVFNTRVNHSTIINDFNFDAGLQYHRIVNKRYFVNAGLVYQVPYSVNARKNFLIERFTVASADYEITQDTIENIVNEKGKVHIPGGIGGGFTFGQKEKWMVGADLSWQNWNKFRNFGVEDSLKSSLRSAAGFSITPNSASLSNYFKRITYRAGVRYQSTYLRLHDQPINEYAVSIGFDFPLRVRNFALYSLGFAAEYGQRGTIKHDLIKENFVRFVIDLSIKETWFFRHKLD